MPLASPVLSRKLAKPDDETVLPQFDVLVTYHPEHVYLDLIHAPSKG